MSLIRKILFSSYAAFCLSFAFSPMILSGAAEGWYLDVPEYSSSYDGVYYMTEQGLVTGYEDGNFRPDDPVTRVEALKMILGATNHDALSIDLALKIPSFPDTEADAWYTPYVALAYNLQIMTGNDDGTLRPETSVNRAEALKMLLLAAEKTAELSTVQNEEWFTPYLVYGADHAVLIPDATGDYLPGQTLTRGELSDLIYRFQKNPFSTTVEYGIASYYGTSFDGHNTASGTALDTDGYMAAHKTLPFGTKIRVTNLSNNTYVDVTVVDRGPYTEGYIVDLTPTAFDQIGSLPTGILHVRLEVLN
jgi:hypothetical protein